MLPAVLPAWTQARSSSIAFLGNHTVEAAPAKQVVASFRAAAQPTHPLRTSPGRNPQDGGHTGAADGGRRAKGSGGGSDDGGVGSGLGNGRRRGGGRGWRGADSADGTEMWPGCSLSGRVLTLEVASLRAELAAHAAAPMIEVATRVATRVAESGRVQGTGESGSALVAASLRCRGTDQIEAALEPDELSRLQALRQTCPGFFAPRGSEPHQLDWLHRRKRI